LRDREGATVATMFPGAVSARTLQAARWFDVVWLAVLDQARMRGASVVASTT
jgi:hypothetical protein